MESGVFPLNGPGDRGTSEKLVSVGSALAFAFSSLLVNFASYFFSSHPPADVIEEAHRGGA